MAVFKPGIGATFAGPLTVSGTSYIGDTANSDVTLGLTINQADADNQIFAGKSSDINHGMTSLAETDTFVAMQKQHATNGGVRISGYSADVMGVQLKAEVTTDNTTKSTAASAAVYFNSAKKTGTTTGAMGANANLAVIANDGTVRFIFDADGDSHQDVGTAWTNFDTHDDIALLNLLSAHVTRRDDPLRDSFRSWLEESRDELEHVRLVTFNDDGHHFVNMSRLAMLHTGAIRQLGRTLETVVEAVRTGNMALLPPPAAHA